MVPEAVIALAAAGGTAIVESAATDLWTKTKDGVLRLFGRDGADAAAQLEETRAELAGLDGAELELARAEHRTRWQRRLIAVLTDDPRAHQELRDLLAATAPSMTLTANAHDQAKQANQVSGTQHNTFN